MIIGVLVIGYWLLVIGYWLLVIGYWLLVIGGDVILFCILVHFWIALANLGSKFAPQEQGDEDKPHSGTNDKQLSF